MSQQVFQSPTGSGGSIASEASRMALNAASLQQGSAAPSKASDHSEARPETVMSSPTPSPTSAGPEMLVDLPPVKQFLVVTTTYHEEGQLKEVPALLYSSTTSKPLLYPMTRTQMGNLWCGASLRGLTITSQYPHDPVSYLAEKMDMPREVINHIITTLDYYGGGSKGSHDGVASWREMYLSDSSIPLGTVPCQDCDASIPATWQLLESRALNMNRASCIVTGVPCQTPRQAPVPPPPPPSAMKRPAPPGLTPHSVTFRDVPRPPPTPPSASVPSPPLAHPQSLLSPLFQPATGPNAIPLSSPQHWNPLESPQGNAQLARSFRDSQFISNEQPDPNQAFKQCLVETLAELGVSVPANKFANSQNNGTQKLIRGLGRREAGEREGGVMRESAIRSGFVGIGGRLHGARKSEE